MNPTIFFFSQFSRTYNLLQFPQQSSFSAQIVALPFLKSLSASPPLSICSFPLLSGSSLFLFPLILVLSNLGSTSGNFSVLHFVLENCFGLFLDLDCSSATQLLLLQVSLSYQVSPPPGLTLICRSARHIPLRIYGKPGCSAPFLVKIPLPFICHYTHSH